MAYAKSAHGIPEELRIRETYIITLPKTNEKATFLAFNALEECCEPIIKIAHDLLNAEITIGNTYPQEHPLTRQQFTDYYFGYFVTALFRGEWDNLAHLQQHCGDDMAVWEEHFLGCFYIKSNYPGRSSHICNGGFLVAASARGMGVGSVLGARYLELAPRLGFRGSIFNLVYASNPASWRIWDKLGFQRIGTIPNAGRLESHGFTDAFVYYYDFVKNQKNNEKEQQQGGGGGGSGDDKSGKHQQEVATQQDGQEKP